jgi:hypothetical protein
MIPGPIRPGGNESRHIHLDRRGARSAACSIHEPHSKIVSKAEASGAGDLSRASLGTMQIWLEKRRDLASELDAMCVPVRGDAFAQWADSTEGQLCRAVRGVASATFEPIQSDHRRYQGGWK